MIPFPTPRGALRALLAGCLVVSAAACGASKADNPFEQASPAETRIMIAVENRGFNDVRLYAVTARGTQSLGPVGGNTHRRIDLPWRQLDQISFRIEVLAGRTYGTMSVTASPGDRVDLIIPDDPNNAYVQVR